MCVSGGGIVKATFFKGIVLGSVVSFAMLSATAAFAGSGVGAVFNLGKFNGVNNTTTLGGSTAGKQLNVVNTKNAPGSTGIGITVHGGKPPLVVNSSTKVSHLNADQIDGLDSTSFQRRLYWAVVKSSGILARGSTAATSSRTSTGTYIVDFAHDVTACSFVATLGSTDSVLGPEIGFVGVAGKLGNAKGVLVWTANSAGAYTDESFHLVAVC